MTAVAIAPIPGVPHRLFSAGAVRDSWRGGGRVRRHFILSSPGDEKVARVFDAPRQFLDALGAVSRAAAEVLAAPDAVRRAAYAYVPELGLTNKGVETLAAVAAVSDRMQVDGKDAMQLGYDSRGLSAKRELAASGAGEAEEGAADGLGASGQPDADGARQQPKRKGRRATGTPEPRGDVKAAEGGVDEGRDDDLSRAAPQEASIGGGDAASTAMPVSSAFAAAAVVWRAAPCEPDGVPAPSLPPLEEDIVLHSRWPETGRLFGHSHEVVCLAVSACGRVVATAARARDAASAAIRLWDALACTHLQTLSGAHHLTVAALEFSPARSPSGEQLGDGAAAASESEFLVAAGKDRAVSLYARVKPNGGGALDLAAQPASASRRAAPAYAFVAVATEAHKRIVWGISWAPHPADSGGVFATGSRDQTVKLWVVGTSAPSSASLDAAPATLTSVSSLPPFPAAVTAVAFAPVTIAEAAAAAGVFRCVLAVGLESGAIGLWVVSREPSVAAGAPAPPPSQVWAWDGGQSAALELPLGAVHTDAVRRLAWRPTLQTQGTDEPAGEAATLAVADAPLSHQLLRFTLASCSSDETLRVLVVTVRR